MVAGQPVAVQSPARNRPSTGVRWRGRSASTPGRTANVAPCSVTTHHRRSRASRRLGPDLGQLGEHGVADRRLVERQQVVRGADDQLQVLAPPLPRRPAALDRRVVEDPLDQPTDRHHVVERADRPVEPEVDPRDRRGPQRLQPRQARDAPGEVAGEQAEDAIERDGQRPRNRRRSSRPTGGSRP